MTLQQFLFIVGTVVLLWAMDTFVTSSPLIFFLLGCAFTVIYARKKLKR